MRRSPLHAVALGAAIVLLSGCATTIAGRALPEGPGGQVNGSPVGTPAPDEALPSGDLPADGATEEPAAEPTEGPTEVAPDVPDLEIPDFGIPTDVLPDFGGFSTELPASWPAGFELPEGTTLYGAVDDATSGTFVVFETPGSVADVAAFLDAEITDLGYTSESSGDFGGVATASYTNGSSTITVGITEYGGVTSGTITITAQR